MWFETDFFSALGTGVGLHLFKQALANALLPEVFQNVYFIDEALLLLRPVFIGKKACFLAAFQSDKLT